MNLRAFFSTQLPSLPRRSLACSLTFSILIFTGCIAQVNLDPSRDRNEGNSSLALDLRPNIELLDASSSGEVTPDDMGISPSRPDVSLTRDAEPTGGDDRGEAGGAGEGRAGEGAVGGSDDTSLEHCRICEDHTALMEGLTTLTFPLQMNAVQADTSRYVPLVWTSPRGRLSTQAQPSAERLAPGWIGYVREARVMMWGHDGVLTDELDQDPEATFRLRLMRWLLGDRGTRVALTGGHQEWLNESSISSQLVTTLRSQGVTLDTLESPITPVMLSSVDVLVVGNPWGEMSDAELDILMTWLSAGRGLLILGCRWSWEAYHPDDVMGDRYSIYELARRLGWSYRDGVIIDPTPDQPIEQPTYTARSLSAWPHALPSGDD